MFFLQVTPSKELVDTLTKSEKTFYVTIIVVLCGALVATILYIRKQHIDRVAEMKQQFAALISQTKEFMESTKESSLAINSFNKTVENINESLKGQTRSNERLIEVVNSVQSESRVGHSAMEAALKQQEKLTDIVGKMHEMILRNFTTGKKRSTAP